ncbi:MAG TPA: hypothetical protein VFL60_03265 [Gaiellaceae bacterium]|nr:hypothetical protein [Gaiellaceae bacterium]
MVKSLLIALAAALALASAAAASDRVALNASHLRLAVSADGKRAMLAYRQGGKTRHALVWGAINALPPSESVPQVRFKIDWTGGWKTYGHTIWQHFGNACRPYDGPALADALAACKAPDGSYWAVQRWQPNLPHRGYPVYRAGQRDWEIDVSHWSGPLASLELHADWAFNGQAHNLFGRLTYAGTPVHGFHTVKGTGAPQDRYGRSLYIDTLDSAYGPGWRRETSIVFRNPTGVFCYSFWPTNDISLPGHPRRPEGHGKAYRIEVLGPGVTPNIVGTVADPGAWNPNDPAKVAFENEMKNLQLQLSQGDKFCPTQT